MPAELLEQIAAIAREKDLFIVSDEVYDRISIKGRSASIYNCAGMPDRTVVINSFSS